MYVFNHYVYMFFPVVTRQPYHPNMEPKEDFNSFLYKESDDCAMGVSMD